MASIDIEIEDILWNMSDYEKQELVDELYEEGFTPKGFPTSNVSIDGDEFDEAVSKLLGNSWKLTKEDEETILKITKKVC